MDWNHAMRPLAQGVSALMAPLFILYIAFCTLCLMNVVTGIFVETAMTHTIADQNIYITQTVLDMFKKSELDEHGEITWESFRSKLDTEELQQMFRSINVDVADAKSLFKLVDNNGNGTVDPRELVDGWIRLRGAAKSLDLATLMHESDQHFRHMDTNI